MDTWKCAVCGQEHAYNHACSMTPICCACSIEPGEVARLRARVAELEAALKYIAVSCHDAEHLKLTWLTVEGFANSAIKKGGA